MGIIISQGLKYSAVRYTAILIGLMATLFVYSRVEDTYGLLRSLQSAAFLCVPFALMGSDMLAIKFYQKFYDPASENKGFLKRLLLICLLGNLLFTILFYSFYPQLVGLFKAQENASFAQYFRFVPILVLFQSLMRMFTFYTSNFKKIVVPGLINELSLKIGLPVLVLFFLKNFISESQLVAAFFGLYLLIDLGHLLYLQHLKEWKWRRPILRISKAEAKEMFSFASFNIFSTINFLLANQIDILMIAAMKPMKDTGIYAIISLISEVIDAPRQAILNISAPILASANEKGDKSTISDIYSKSALNQSIAALFIAVGILSSVKELFQIMPNAFGYLQQINVVFLLVFAKLTSSLFGVSYSVIQYSAHYRFNFYAICFMAIINIVLNLLLIPKYGLEGAAMATFTSALLFGIIKFAFIWIKMGMQPFNLRFLVIFAFGIACYLSSQYLFPFRPDNSILQSVSAIAMRSIFIGLVFPLMIYFSKVSMEVNNLIDNLLKKLRRS